VSNDNIQNLVVDLDGTLVRSDTLIESLFRLALERPWIALQSPLWLLGGKASFKQRVAKWVQINPESLPYHDDLLFFLRRERAKGKKLILATAAHSSIAEAVAEYVGIFEKTICTQDGGINLSGKNKVLAIPEEYRPFVYAGNSLVDVDVWQSSAGAIVIGNERLLKKAEKVTDVVKWFKPSQSAFTSWRRALRIHQWAKNALIFLPLILAHKFQDSHAWLQAFVGFFSFSLIASSVYLVNDLVDLESDRQHPEKKLRSLASGQVSLTQGTMIAILLLLFGMGIAHAQSKMLFFVLLGYYGLTTVYSFYLKRIPILDAFTLAGLYTWRILSGGVVTGTRLTFWLIAFSMFFFLSLAFAKRSTELKLMLNMNKKKVSGRGYFTEDLDMVNLLGVGAGIGSVVIFSMYISQPVITQLYQSPKYLLAVAIALLYWISRIWLLTSRAQMNSDPILFAIKDRGSYLLLLFVAICLAASKYLGG